MTSPYGNAIVPIQEILWIYKHSTLHKMLWYHFSISYTMHITANKHMYVNCPKIPNPILTVLWITWQKPITTFW